MLNFVTIIVVAHVTLGVFAVAAGAIALIVRKGQRTHIGVGRLFVVSMGLSSLLGAALGIAKSETLYITFHAGILGATLVASGYLVAGIRLPARKPWFVIVAVVNAMNAFGLATLGLYAATRPDTALFGFQAADYLFLFAMAAVASVSDLGLLLCKQITDRHRIAQHLWRMCIGFFIAAGSAFTGPGATALPDAIQASGVLSLPELIIVLLMLYWLFVTLRRRFPDHTVAS